MVELISNPSAERAILTLCIKNIDNLIECNTNDLFSDHFSIKANSYIYTAICYLVESENVKNIDSNVLYTVLSTNSKATEELEKLGGMSYVDNLCQSYVNEENLNVFIKQVKENSSKRMLFGLAEDLKKEVFTEKHINEILDDAQKKILGLMLESTNEEKVYKVGSTLRERLKERAENPKDVYGYRLGWNKFDYYTQGLENNDLIVVVAPSKTGKSALLENMTRILTLDSGLKGLYIDTEVNDEQFEDRLISMVSGIPFSEIRNGKFNENTEFGTKEEKLAKMNTAIELIERNKIFHIYMPDFSIEKVNALIRKYKIQESIDYCVFDYIKLPNDEVKSLNTSQEYQKLGYFTTCLKDMAGICDMPIITACQSNRNNLDSKEPDASDIGGSYRILQLASKLFFLRNKLDNEMEAEGFARGNQKLHIKYQRNGEGDKEVDIQFDRPILRMYEV